MDKRKSIYRLTVEELEVMLWDSWEKELAERASNKISPICEKSGDASVLSGATPDHNQKKEF